VVSSASRASACIACVWRIQCGLARRSFSAVAGAVQLDNLGHLAEEPTHHSPQARGRDAGGAVLFETGDQRGLRGPSRRCEGQFALHQMLVERRSCQGRQRHLARLAALAHQVQPVITMRIQLDLAERRADQVADAQTRGIGEVENEAQAQRCRRLLAMTPFEPLAHRLDHRPLALAEDPGGGQWPRARGAADFDARERVSGLRGRQNART